MWTVVDGMRCERVGVVVTMSRDDINMHEYR
jgi:hypothetical protein